MKIRMTVTLELEDPQVYDLDNEGEAVGIGEGKIERAEVGEYVFDAVRMWGGQHAPGSVLFSSNIKNVRVQGTGFDIGEKS